MAAPEKARRLTEAEYLVRERAADFKSEFYDGEMFAMAGGTPRHSLIAVNLASELSNKLKGRDCLAFNSDLRLKVETAGLFTYPDLSVVCGRLTMLNDGDDTFLNPILIAEVLSDSTEAYDRGKKFEIYQQIPSLREYVLVSQKEARVEQFIRQPGGEWLLRAAVGLGASLMLPSVEITISLAEVYAKVQFDPSPFRAAAPPRT